MLNGIILHWLLWFKHNLVIGIQDKAYVTTFSQRIEELKNRRYTSQRVNNYGTLVKGTK